MKLKRFSKFTLKIAEYDVRLRETKRKDCENGFAERWSCLLESQFCFE